MRRSRRRSQSQTAIAPDSLAARLPARRAPRRHDGCRAALDRGRRAPLRARGEAVDETLEQPPFANARSRQHSGGWHSPGANAVEQRRLRGVARHDPAARDERVDVIDGADASGPLVARMARPAVTRQHAEHAGGEQITLEHARRDESGVDAVGRGARVGTGRAPTSDAPVPPPPMLLGPLSVTSSSSSQPEPSASASSASSAAPTWRVRADLGETSGEQHGTRARTEDRIGISRGVCNERGCTPALPRRSAVTSGSSR